MKRTVSVEEASDQVRHIRGKGSYWFGYHFKQQALFEKGWELFRDSQEDDTPLTPTQAISKAAKYIETFEEDVVDFGTRKHFTEVK